MSASERLKALPATGDPWFAFNALPELTAVVEAAEKYTGHKLLKRPLATLNELVALSTALTALDEALTTKGER